MRPKGRNGIISKQDIGECYEVFTRNHEEGAQEKLAGKRLMTMTTVVVAIDFAFKLPWTHRGYGTTTWVCEPEHDEMSL